MDDFDHVDVIIIRLIAAAVCGGVIGWERESQHKPAGLRTHIMVALGACTFGLLATPYEDALNDHYTRVVQGIAGGIGFLGAGAIIQSGGHVKGLTTAAGLWAAAGVGVAHGLGAYWVGGLVTVLALATLLLEWLADAKPGRNDEPDGEGRG